MLKFLFSIVFFITFYNSNSQDFRNSFPFKRPVNVYNDSIKTVQIFKSGFTQSLPVLNLNKSNEKLEIHFDLLGSEPGYFMYKVVHCDANWNESNLTFYDYADGLPEDYITDFKTSSTIDIRYTHYQLQLPNNNLKFNFSGNYKLVVYDETTKNTVLELGFLVFEPKVNIAYEPKRASNAELRFAGQEIDFVVKSNNYRLTNPYQDLKVFVLQNFRNDNSIALDPLFVKADEIDYNYEEENVFFGGNEFRPLDLRNLSINSTIAQQNRTNLIWQFTTYPLEKRNFLSYKTTFDINGRYVDVDNDNFFDAKTNNNYVKVKFVLADAYLYTQRKVFVFGEISHWKYLPEFEMELNPENGFMEKEVLLKQGYYNYLFLVTESNKTPTPLSNASWDIEGTHHQTENEYQILVYHKAAGTYHDALVGFAFFQFPQRN